jgi:hypothetical protein
MRLLPVPHRDVRKRGAVAETPIVLAPPMTTHIDDSVCEKLACMDSPNFLSYIPVLEPSNWMIL